MNYDVELGESILLYNSAGVPRPDFYEIEFDPYQEGSKTWRMIHSYNIGREGVLDKNVAHCEEVENTSDLITELVKFRVNKKDSFLRSGRS